MRPVASSNDGEADSPVKHLNEEGFQKIHGKVYFEKLHGFLTFFESKLSSFFFSFCFFLSRYSVPKIQVFTQIVFNQVLVVPLYNLILGKPGIFYGIVLPNLNAI